MDTPPPSGVLGPLGQPVTSGDPPPAAFQPLGVSAGGGGVQPPSTPSTIPPAPGLPTPVEACKRDRMKLVLSLAAMGYLMVVTAIYGYCLIRGLKIDGEAASAMTMIAGFATGLVKDAYSFVFGSSQGSEDKTTALTAAATAPAKQ